MQSLKLELYFRMILKFIFISFILLFKSETSFTKKMVNMNGKMFECKLPKNSFERTRGVRTRICIFNKEDNEIINKMRNKKKSQKKR